MPSDEPLSYGHRVPPRANRLFREASPYLLQHAYNPVDWFPWGNEAFEKASREDKPVFLSIGYSTCHWCHVMAHESFEDETVARLLNEAFICVKVDREERPDVDSVYMAVCQLLTGGGGWPLTLLLTPDKKPFFAATYIPKRARFGQAGLLDLVPRVRELWKSRRGDVRSSADQIAAALRSLDAEHPDGRLDESILALACRQLEQRFDERRGGFGNAPKFPTAHHLLFLLRTWKRTGEGRALAMVEKTLQAMRDGGIYDHVGFGFHRYATDNEWLVPHFEKMLYDQALLALAYTEAFQATGKEAYAQTAREVLIYVLRDMTSPAGGFYSAEDADSEGEEGKFYLWTREEVERVLRDDAPWVLGLFSIREGGNYPAHPGGPEPGLNILHLTQQHAGLGAGIGPLDESHRARFEAARERLLAARERRVRPHKDDKILTGWNGLMIAAFARAAAVLDEPRYAQAAARAADFLLTHLRRPDGRLLHCWRPAGAGELPRAQVTAYADDYAFLVWGLLELYEATFEVRFLEAAIAQNDALLQHHWSPGRGGLFFTADDAERLLVRRKEAADNAVPSANSVALLNLLRLARLTGRADLEEKAQAIANAFSSEVRQAPLAYTQFLVGVDFALAPSGEVVVVGRADARDTQAMLCALRSRYVPHCVLLFRPSGEAAPDITRLAPFTREQTAISGKATAYVCRRHACEQPTTDPAEMIELLERR